MLMVFFFNPIWILCWFFCAISLLCLHNTLITTNFDFLKYINKIVQIPKQCIFNAQQRTTSRKSVRSTLINMLCTINDALNELF